MLGFLSASRMMPLPFFFETNDPEISGHMRLRYIRQYEIYDFFTFHALSPPADVLQYT